MSLFVNALLLGWRRFYFVLASDVDVVKRVGKKHFVQKLVQRAHALEILVVVVAAKCWVDANEIAASPLELEAAFA